MLRLLVLALLLANAGYFAWTQGLLADYGFAPAVQAEPQRLAQQVRPQAMQLLTAADARQLESAASPAAPPAPAAAECLQAGLFSPEQSTALRTGLESSLPIGSWTLESSVEPGRWIVYMGKYNSEDALIKKRSELRGLGVSFEALVNPRWGQACRWAITARKPRPNANWPRPPRAACAPPRWCWSGPRLAASC
jgi:uncharacterized caspase-like protein